MSDRSLETELQRRLDDWCAAIRARDVDAVMAHYAADVIAFDLLPPMQYRGADAVRRRLSDWLGSFDGPIGFDMRHVSITAGNDVAFYHSLNGVSATTRMGVRIEMWWRATVCLRRINGAWLIVHAHSSEPFDMPSGKAMLDLRP